MKRGLVLAICIGVLLRVAALAQPRSNESAKIVADYGKLPLAFEVNQGQSDPQVKFLSKGAGYSLFLTPDAAVLVLPPSVAPPLESRDKTSHPQSARAVLQLKL